MKESGLIKNLLSQIQLFRKVVENVTDPKAQAISRDKLNSLVFELDQLVIKGGVK